MESKDFDCLLYWVVKTKLLLWDSRFRSSPENDDLGGWKASSDWIFEVLCEQIGLPLSHSILSTGK